jgi:hypothetical protein
MRAGKCYPAGQPPSAQVTGRRGTVYGSDVATARWPAVLWQMLASGVALATPLWKDHPAVFAGAVA